MAGGMVVCVQWKAQEAEGAGAGSVTGKWASHLCLVKCTRGDGDWLWGLSTDDTQRSNRLMRTLSPMH